MVEREQFLSDTAPQLGNPFGVIARMNAPKQWVATVPNQTTPFTHTNKQA